MGQRQHSLRKLQTPDIGVCIIHGNFPSGAQEDDSFTDAALSDGYVALPDTAAPNDAYGAGFKGVLRVGVGRYDIVMDRVYAELIHASGSIFCATSKGLTVQFDSPAMTSGAASGDETRSIIHLRICDESGLDTDLQYEDRVSFQLVFRNSSA